MADALTTTKKFTTKLSKVDIQIQAFQLVLLAEEGTVFESAERLKELLIEEGTITNEKLIQHMKIRVQLTNGGKEAQCFFLLPEPVDICDMM